MTASLQEECTEYGRSLSTGPLLVPRERPQSMLRMIEEKLRGIYETLTCTRTSDVARRPPRPSTQQYRPHVPESQRPSTHQQRPHITESQRPHAPSPQRAHIPEPHRHFPRPRLTQQGTPRPPPPDQAGGSSWQQQASFDLWQQPIFQSGGSTFEQHTPMPEYSFRPPIQPHGIYMLSIN